MSKKLLQITMHYYPLVSGGQQLYVEELHRIATSMGYESQVLQPQRGCQVPEWVITTCPPRGIRKLGPHVSWFWFNMMLLLNKEIIKTSSIVVSHYPFHYPLLPKASKAIVLSHGVDWPRIPIKSVDKYKAWAAQLCTKRKVPIVANDTAFLRRIGLPVKPGMNPYNLVNDHAWYIPNAVDTAKYMSLKSVNASKIILVPRNIRKSRGILLAIESFAEFSRIVPSYSLYIAGAGKQGRYYESCIQRISELGLNDSVNFIGEVPHEEMMQLYSNAVMTLIPTLAFEGTSYSALESMASGTPVLSTNVGGLMDLPTEKADADPLAFAEGMVNLLDCRNSVSQRQKEEICRDYDIRKWRKAWSRVFEWRLSIQ